jgi:hypothetical protein
MIAAARWHADLRSQLSLTIAMIMPARTTRTIAAWSQSQVGDIGG